MRIAHVVTYISPDGAFGGPVRVALGQAAALAERGHEVTVYAGAPRDLATVSSQDGYTLKTFPARRVFPGGGFAAMASPALTRALRRECGRYGVAHVHLARDLVTIPAGMVLRRARVPYVVQPHGMVDATERVLAKPLDLLATRPLLRSAAAVLALTEREVEDIAEVEPSARSHRIANGIRVVDQPPYEGRSNTVLFLARMHERKRPMAFVRMAEILQDELPETNFVLAGPDEGEGAAITEAIRTARPGSRITWIGAVAPDQTDKLLATARVYVLPAFNEVFPMTILEAFRAGTPVVTTSELGIADECLAFGAAAVTDGSPETLAREVARILRSPAHAHDLRSGSWRMVRERLSVAAVAESLEARYIEAASHKALGVR